MTSIQPGPPKLLLVKGVFLELVYTYINPFPRMFDWVSPNVLFQHNNQFFGRPASWIGASAYKVSPTGLRVQYIIAALS